MKEDKCPDDEEEVFQAQLDIWKYALGFSELAVIKCATELRIADILENNKNPMTLQDLSSSLNCSPSSLYRIMRFLTHRRIFKEIAPSTYSQTPISRLLIRNSDKSFADLVLLESSPVMLDPWQCLRGRVLDEGSPAFEAAHGEDLWSYAERDPIHSKLINDGLASTARAAVSAMIDGCPEVFEGIRSLVDVGGGNGTTLGKLIKGFPWIKGINFDLPHVVSVAPQWSGVENVGGDMFKSVPKADAAFLMSVLHDWGDEECIEILKKCKEAISDEEKGKVIIVEAVIDEEEGEEEQYKKLKDVRLRLDMVMMAHTSTGKERNSKEWAYVLTQAGFSRHTIKSIQAIPSVIQAYP